MPQAKRTEASVQVDIYITAGCHNCRYAQKVAEMIRRTFPQVAVRLIDLAAAPGPIPPGIFATPTYLLNGQLWSLGNPSSQEVEQRLTAALALRRT